MQHRTASAQARFLGGAETDAEVNIDTSFYTLGKITFDNTHAYKLSGLPLLMQDTGNAEIAVLSGSHEIAADLALGSNLRITGSGTLTISGPIDWSGKSNRGCRRTFAFSKHHPRHS